MKRKTISLIGAAALVCGGLFSGCTSVSSTQKFNAIGMGTVNEKAVCLTHVEIPGYFFLGLPIFVGSAMGDGEMAIFMNTLTPENVVNLLTREAKKRGAARMIDVQVTTSEHSVFPFITKEVIQGSGIGVRTKAQAAKQAQIEYDLEP